MENEKTIGTLLRKSRESKKLTIEEVSTKTKINLNILRYLETDDLDNLPNKTYVKGFVKNYAKIVGISQSEAISTLENTYLTIYPQEVSTEPTAEQTETIKKENQSEAQEKVISIVHSLVSKKALISFVVLIIGIFVIKGLVAFFSQISSEQVTITKVEKTTTPESVTEVIKVEDTTIKDKESNLFDLKAAQKLKDDIVKKENAKKLEEEAQAAREAEAQELAEKAKEDKKQAEKEKVKRTANLNGKYPFINFYSAPTNMYEVLENAEENNDNDILPNRLKKSVEDGVQNVYVHSTDGDTWISYQSDEEDIKRFVLKKGRSVLIKGKVVLLFMGNLNVAKIFLNNKLINAESKTGVKSIIFPQSEAKNYELPLFPSYKGIPMKSSVYKENMAEAPIN